MSHAVLLRLQIAQVIGIGCHLDGDVLDNLQSVSLQTDTLHGVIGEQTHLMDAEMTEQTLQ